MTVTKRSVLGGKGEDRRVAYLPCVLGGTSDYDNVEAHCYIV